MRYFRTESSQHDLARFLSGLLPEERSWLLCELMADQWGANKVIPKSADLLKAEFWLLARTGVAPNNWRNRVWLIFMLLRYGALRLKEIFGMEPDAMDFRLGVARISGQRGREVPLPLAAVRAILPIWPIWQRVASSSSSVNFLACDPSQLRRALQDCARNIGLSAGLLAPRALRHARARELELLGLHPALVSIFLGRRPESSHTFKQPCNLLRMRIQKEHIMKTSARNVFQGKVVKLADRGILTDVEIATANGLNVKSVITKTSRENLGLAIDKIVTALIKAPWVNIQSAAQACSEENCYNGVAREINQDENAREIVAELQEGNLICGVDLNPKGALEINEGDNVKVCFEPLAVILTVD